MEKAKAKTLTDYVWNFFTSVKLAVVIFVILSVTSIIGTLIEQNAEPERNIKVLAKLFGESAAPAAFRIFNSLGFMDMYHSWWFVTILLLLATNLIVCSLEKLPSIMRLVKEPMKPLSEEQIKKFGISREIALKGRHEDTKEMLKKTIKKVTGLNISEVREETGYQLYSQKGNYARLGVYIVHFSIIVILIGAVTGIFFGFKTFLPLPEGVTASSVEGKKGEVIPLGFSIRCDDFNVEFYGNSDMPKKYKSSLSVIKDGKEVMKKTISVNDPLTYNGITFYQSSYGIVPGGGENSVFKFRVTSKDGRTEEADLKFGGSFTIPGTNLIGKIEDFSPALGIDEKTGKPYTYAEQMNNPAAYISFYENNKRKYGGWVLKRYPETGKLPEGHTIQFLDLWGLQYTGLQVRKDPGVWIVYLGCIAMALGLYTAFFMNHRRLWVKVIEERNNSRVIIGATAHKNKHGFERKIDRIAGLLSKEGGK